MKRTRFLTVTAMLSGMAVILQYLGSFIGLKVGGFLDVELSDLPAMIGALALGPLCGVAIELIKNLLHCLISHTAFVGELSNFLINGSFVFIAGLIYGHNKTKKTALIGLLSATVLYAAIGMALNYFVMLPLYNIIDPALKKELVLWTITPFNVVKGLILSAITLLVYKKLSGIIKKA